MMKRTKPHWSLGMTGAVDIMLASPGSAQAADVAPLRLESKIPLGHTFRACPREPLNRKPTSRRTPPMVSKNEVVDLIGAEGFLDVEASWHGQPPHNPD
jgi:hypothetical protein